MPADHPADHPVGDPHPLLRLLWQELAVVPQGLLGLDGDIPFQPFFHLPQPADPVIWFLTDADGDLARHVANSGPRPAQYRLTGTGHRLQAHLSGPLSSHPDRQGLQHAWTPAAERRQPGGLGDIETLPLRFLPERVWLRLPDAPRSDPLHHGITQSFAEWH